MIEVRPGTLTCEPGPYCERSASENVLISVSHVFAYSELGSVNAIGSGEALISSRKSSSWMGLPYWSGSWIASPL